MLKAAIEKIQEMSRPLIREVEGRAFYFHGDEATEVRPEIDTPETLTLSSLDALVKLVKTEALKKYKVPFYLTIPTHTCVKCFGQSDPEARHSRITHYIAKATDVPGWGESEELGFETAMIALRTRFQPTNDAEYALKLLSNITNGAKTTTNDNGIATSVVMQSGISLQTNEIIRPIVSLKPYRTFQEVEQPSSQFLIRVRERSILFTEADGGMWKLTARQTIKAYFEEVFAAEIEDGTVVVAI